MYCLADGHNNHNNNKGMPKSFNNATNALKSNAIQQKRQHVALVRGPKLGKHLFVVGDGPWLIPESVKKILESQKA